MQEEKQVAKREGIPSQLIERAIDKGADLDKLEKLLTLQERWEANEARKEFYQALNDGRRPEVDGEEALETQRIVWNIYKSAKEGRRVYL